jgi:hypothetical protein
VQYITYLLHVGMHLQRYIHEYLRRYIAVQRRPSWTHLHKLPLVHHLTPYGEGLDFYRLAPKTQVMLLKILLSSLFHEDQNIKHSLK